MSHSNKSPQVHQHEGKSCPVTGKHGFCPVQPSDSRSPCPALNTMANHGYINRNGRNLSAWQVFRGLKACYGLSTPLALFLSYVGFAMLKRVRPIELFHIGQHNVIEHNASLVHHDTPSDEKYAPTHIDPMLVTHLINDAKDGVHEDDGQTLINAVDVARARVRRERECGPVDKKHAEIARGEMAIILGVWETHTKDKVGIPAEWMRGWIGHEKLPDGWKPTHTQGLWNTIMRSRAIRFAMREIRKGDPNSSSATSVTLSLDEKARSSISSQNPKVKL